MYLVNSRLPIDFGIMLSQPLYWEVSADTPLKSADFPTNILLVVPDTHGQRLGIFLARTLDGRSIGTGHFYGVRSPDPRQFMLEYEFRVHNCPGTAGIHQKVPFTLAILTILIYPVQNCSDEQTLAMLRQRRLCFTLFGERRVDRLTLCFSLCETHY
jgi:hypothetical protein